MIRPEGCVCCWEEGDSECPIHCPPDLNVHTDDRIGIDEPIYPHCDSNVLHAPGECEICDEFAPKMQAERQQKGINFTGHNDTKLQPCPSTKRRRLADINAWGGNRPWLKAPK